MNEEDKKYFTIVKNGETYHTIAFVKEHQEDNGMYKCNQLPIKCTITFPYVCEYIEN